MFTTAPATVLAALPGARVRACVANPAVITTVTAWYATAMDATSGFDHKHPARRPPSLT
jgi:hypothetical protein